ncbi:MAG: fumarylacetoacetate hydrolase family protein [Sphingobium sp.]|uniref:fumarylacetoacetate hydrolase family protein n=1 Tax=Sphingobium sp. TaxID=1912891 RepID=UPI0029A7E97E|nr:fumarylacetoacetate hydrolase family protein [Sphingobium sp.]MDX3910590.1 fumarylacetoacetate hydrolase family protein [Sphingobium sp.]
MKLLTFDAGQGARLGVVAADGSIVDLSATGRADFATMQTLIEGGPKEWDAARAEANRSAGLDPAQIVILAPLPRPVQMRDFLVFEVHMRGAVWNGAKLRERLGDGPAAPATPPPIPDVWYQQPIYYKCNRFAVAGPGRTALWPEWSKVIDYELELACIIGKGGRDIAVADAADHIFGYTIFNDLTARDAQFKEMQGPLGPAKGKDFDGANVLGPVIVTPDEIEPQALAMRAFVNDELWSEGSSSTMHWSFAEMIAHVSRSETLHAGEVLGSGTVGNGCGLELGKMLKHGDRVTLEIEGIGRQVTTIHAPHVAERLVL